MKEKSFILNSNCFPKLILWSLIFLQFLLVFLDYFFNYLDIWEIKQIRRIFNIAREVSLSTWFSCLQLFFIGLIMWLIYFLKKDAKTAGWKRLGWAAIGTFFIFLSIDDSAKVHERLGHVFKYSYLESLSQNGSFFASTLLNTFPSWGWQILVAPVYALIGFLIVIFIWHELDNRLNKLFFLMALCIFAVAIGIDYIEGLEGAYDVIKKSTGFKMYTITHYSKVIEEFLEMLGSSIIIYVCLSYLMSMVDVITVKFLNKH